MHGYKSRKGLIVYLTTFVAIIVVFFAVALALFAWGVTTIFSDSLLWLLLLIIVVGYLLLFLFQYAFLPARLITIDAEGAVIYGLFNHPTVLPFNQIIHIGLLPRPQKLLFKPSTLVVTTKECGVFAVSYLKDFAQVYQYFQDQLNQFIVAAPDVYFHS